MGVWLQMWLQLLGWILRWSSPGIPGVSSQAVLTDFTD